MTSYRKRKREIEYYRQCVSELEQMVVELARMNGMKSLPLLLRKGVDPDDYLTPYNTEQFSVSVNGMLN